MRAQTLLSLAALSASLLLPRAAGATANFPPEIKKHLGLSSTPDCTVCHATDEGGTGTVTKPFGKSLRGRGLLPDNTGSLDTALDALAAEHTDSDKDGVGDIDELKAGTDPNVGAGGAEVSTAEPTYGCIGRIAGGQGEGGIAALIAALGTAAALRRQNRKRLAARLAVYRGVSATRAGLRARPGRFVGVSPVSPPLSAGWPGA